MSQSRRSVLAALGVLGGAYVAGASTRDEPPQLQLGGHGGSTGAGGVGGGGGGEEPTATVTPGEGFGAEGYGVPRYGT